jgi:hypothetical protein
MLQIDAILRQKEEGIMSSIDGGKIHGTSYTNVGADEPREQLSGSMAGSIFSNRKSTDPILDQEYVRMMEESYGIRDEGIF